MRGGERFELERTWGLLAAVLHSTSGWRWWFTFSRVDCRSVERRGIPPPFFFLFWIGTLCLRPDRFPLSADSAKVPSYAQNWSWVSWKSSLSTLNGHVHVALTTLPLQASDTRAFVLVSALGYDSSSEELSLLLLQLFARIVCLHALCRHCTPRIAYSHVGPNHTPL